MVAAVSRVQPVAYGEIVATVSSKSAGPGTRRNIDEFTRTTAHGIEKVGGRSAARRSSSQPCRAAALMRDTVHCLTEVRPTRRGSPPRCTR